MVYRGVEYGKAFREGDVVYDYPGPKAVESVPQKNDDFGFKVNDTVGVMGSNCAWQVIGVIPGRPMPRKRVLRVAWRLASGGHAHYVLKRNDFMFGKRIRMVRSDRVMALADNGGD
jgi:hypothetical protein